jgi:signal transduction histidine kinase
MTGQEVFRNAAGYDSAALQDISDVLETGCVIVDENLVVRGWNRWMESASGISAGSVIGERIDVVLELDDDSVAVRSFKRALAGESVVLAQQFHDFMFPLPAPAGFSTIEHMQQSARVVPFIIDGMQGAVALVEDVTERVMREQDLNDAREKAESASKTKSEFLAAISHELRTPLTAVLGYADLLQSEISGPLNSLQHDHLERITAGTWHLIKIIEEILAFSRVEAKKYDVTLEPVKVGDIINQTAALLQQQASQKGITLDIKIPEPGLIMETDALKLRQIILNLLGNAIKFTDSGGVTVEALAVGDSLYCRVSDTGAGVPERMKKLIFEPFVQADQSTTRAKGGTGLGLALSRALAELLGGELTLESTGPQGSVFKLKLPLRQVRISGHSHVGDVDAAIRELKR